MKNSDYTNVKLAIYERFKSGEITEFQCDECLAKLESTKEDTEITPKKAIDFLDELGEKYPDIKDAADKLSDKVKKLEDSESDDSDKDTDDEEDNEVSEACDELMDFVNNSL